MSRMRFRASPHSIDKFETKISAKATVRMGKGFTLFNSD